jgi:hypothetical protein
MKKISNVLHGQRGSITAVEKCFSAVRRGGRVSILGVYGTRHDNFPLGQMVETRGFACRPARRRCTGTSTSCSSSSIRGRERLAQEGSAAAGARDLLRP